MFIGFITQERIIGGDDYVCMTPGISLKNENIADQRYRHIKDIETDYLIIGRVLYNSPNILREIHTFLEKDDKNTNIIDDIV